MYVVFSVSCKFVGDQTSRDADKEVRDVALWVVRADLCSFYLFD